MDLLSSIKTIRVMLAVTVSLWLAGTGCLFGCSYGSEPVVQAANVSNPTVVSGPSCHAMKSHDCCAKKTRSRVDDRTVQHETLKAIPSGMMSDCPLAVSQTAAVSKSTSDSPAALPVQNSTPRIDYANVDSRLAARPLSIPNRGPTHVLHCVFLI